MTEAAPLLALTRAVPPSLAECELTHRTREPFDIARAVRQHEAYEDALRALGCEVRRLPDAPTLPDSLFVEDCVVVLDEVAVLTRPGAASRRPEVASVAEALAPLRPLAEIVAPGTLDGGDVLRLGQTLYVGRSARSNDSGIAQLATLLAPFGYTVHAVPLTGCLHLKSAVTAVSDRLLLLNPAWVDPAVFAGWEAIAVAPDEPNAANALRIGDAVIHPAAASGTRRRLEALDLRVVPVEVDELEKAEAGVTCCSVLVRTERGRRSLVATLDALGDTPVALRGSP